MSLRSASAIGTNNHSQYLYMIKPRTNNKLGVLQ